MPRQRRAFATAVCLALLGLACASDEPLRLADATFELEGIVQDVRPGETPPPLTPSSPDPTADPASTLVPATPASRDGGAALGANGALEVRIETFSSADDGCSAARDTTAMAFVTAETTIEPAAAAAQGLAGLDDTPVRVSGRTLRAASGDDAVDPDCRLVADRIEIVAAASPATDVAPTADAGDGPAALTPPPATPTAQPSPVVPAPSPGVNIPALTPRPA